MGTVRKSFAILFTFVFLALALPQEAGAVQLTITYMGNDVRVVANFPDGSAIAIDSSRQSQRVPTIRWMSENRTWLRPQRIAELERIPISSNWPDNAVFGMRNSGRGLYTVQAGDNVLVLGHRDGFDILGPAQKRMFIKLPFDIEIGDLTNFELDASRDTYGFLRWTAKDGRQGASAFSMEPFVPVASDDTGGISPNEARFVGSRLNPTPPAAIAPPAATPGTAVVPVAQNTPSNERSLRPNQRQFEFANGNRLVMERVGDRPGLRMEFDDGREPLLITEDTVIQYPVRGTANGIFETSFANDATALPVITEREVLLVRNDGSVERLPVNMSRLMIRPFEIQGIQDRSAQMTTHRFRHEGKGYYVLSFGYRATAAASEGTAEPSTTADTDVGETFLVPDDGPAFRVAFHPIENNTSTPVSRVEDGILALRGIERRIDLRHLLAESRFNAQLVPNPRTNDNKEIRDVIAAVEEIFPDMMRTFGPNGQQSHALQPEDLPIIGDMRVALSTQETGNAVVLGPSGSGKTQLVRSLVRSIAAGEFPEIPRTVRIPEIDRGVLEQGTQFVGNFESRVNALIVMASRVPVILFMDEIHSLVGAGTSSTSPVDFFNMIKKQLADGTIRVIGTSTSGEFYAAFGGDTAILRRFQAFNRPVMGRPQVEASVDSWVRRYRLPAISPEVRNFIIDSSERHMAVGAQPSKATALLDRAYARHRTLHQNTSPLTRESVIDTLVSMGVDRRIFDPEAARASLENFRTNFSARVVGQELVRDAAEAQMRRYLAGTQDPNRPAMTILTNGGFGVGKTLAGQVIAEITGRPAVMMNMADYPDHRLEVFQQALVQAVRTNASTLFILDEGNLAGEKVQALLLAITSQGQVDLPDFVGNARTATGTTTVNFRNAGFYITTNAGHEQIPQIYDATQTRPQIGFMTSTEAAGPADQGSGMRQARQRMEQDRRLRNSIATAEQRILPALVSRMEAVVPSFSPTSDQFRGIIRVHLDLFRAQVQRQYGVEVHFGNQDAFIESATSVYFEPRVDSRVVSRLIQTHVGEAVTTALSNRDSSIPLARVELEFSAETGNAAVKLVGQCEAAVLP